MQAPASPVLELAIADREPAVRRNAAEIASLAVTQITMGGKASPSLMLAGKLAQLAADEDPQVRLAALRGLGGGAFRDETAAAIVAAWPKLNDDFQRSAAVGAAAQNPAQLLIAALQSPQTDSLAPLASALTEQLVDKGWSGGAARVVIALAEKPASADPLKRSILEALAKGRGEAPQMVPELASALSKLLASGVGEAALPLAARWDTAGALKPEIAKLTGGLIITLNDAQAADEARLAAAQNLLGLRSANADAVPAVARLLGSGTSAQLQKSLILALSETSDPAVGTLIAAAWAKLPEETQSTAFDALLKRADWTLAFLDAVQAKQIDPSTLGPASTFRLRTHADKAVAQRATAMLDLLNPMAKLKNEAVAKLAPIVDLPGNVQNGRAIFTSTCATCHQFGDIGTLLGPVLTGMGAHGPGELLTAIVDPNREVEPSFLAWNIETKDGQFFNGVIARENPTSIVLRSLAGEQEVRVADIKSRVNTGRSLMPEGFEALGGEALRDIIAFMQNADGAGRFRTLDLTPAFTANTSRGIYLTQAQPTDSLKFSKSGTVKVEGVPFNIVAPDKAPANIVVLRGGPEDAFSKTLPARVTIPVGGFRANRLHFLGGIAGWGHPFGGENEVVLRAHVQYAGGERETLEFRNGYEFADYIRVVEVPGSKLTQGLVKENQLRWFSKQLKQTAPIEQLVLESTNTLVAPTTVAITAELADPNSPLTVSTSGAEDRGVAAPKATPDRAAAEPQSDIQIAPEFNAPVPQPPTQANGPRVLLVGGGSSHDFAKWFGDFDKKLLAEQLGWIDFTMNANGAPAVFPNVDLLVWSANQPISSATRKALMDWVNTGKPLVLLHPALWYNWNNFPEWNREIAGGGSRGHDKFGEFTVNVVNREHPLTKGLPESFRITDELYYFQPEQSGTAIEILAAATSTQKPGTYPQVFIVKHPKAKIAAITLGTTAERTNCPSSSSY
jgi:putative heme-binding domain-containing protein